MLTLSGAPGPGTYALGSTLGGAPHLPSAPKYSMKPRRPPRPSDAFFVFETAPDKTSVPSARGSAVVDFEKPRFLSFLSRYVEGNAIFSFPKLSSGCSCSLSALYPPELKLGALLLARLYNNSL